MLNNPTFMLSLPVLPSTRAQAEGSEDEGSKHENYFQQSASPHISPEREARGRRCPEIQGARETKRAGVLYSTSSPLSEPSAVDSGLPHIALAKWGKCASAAVGW